MINRILCIGAGYVGGPTMAVIAKHCPHLQEVVRTSLGRNLRFTGDVEHEISEAEMIFVSVNTPTKTFGQGAGRAADLQYWEQTARSILQHAKGETIVVEKSTLPVRTAEAMERILRSGERQSRFEVLSNPEFMAEGSAIADLEHPDRVLIGSAATASGQAAMQELVEIYARWVPRDRILTTNVWSSELSK